MTKKRDGLGNELGRSMIEMLGVLAIVGVLSIGAISGFSKAMAKYKLTRFFATYSMFIQDVMKYQKDWVRTRRAAGFADNVDSQFDLAPLLEQMGLIPSSWQRLNDKYITDDNGGFHRVDVRNNQTFEFQYSFHASGKQLNSKEEIQRCVFLLNDVLKQLDRLYHISFWKGGTMFGPYIYGKQYCSTYNVCLNKLTYNQIYDRCAACTRANSNCGIVYRLK